MRFKLAFSMIELVMVIVIIGILASLAIPRMKRDIRQEAIDTILSDIRLAQQNALLDSKHDVNNTNWQKAYWHFAYYKCGNSDFVYRVASDINTNEIITNQESAINSKDKKYLFADCADLDSINNSSKVNLTENYGINEINATGVCAISHIVAFDNLGRLHSNITGNSPNYEFLAKGSCNIKFSFEDNSDPFTVEIEPIVGHIRVVGQEYL